MTSTLKCHFTALPKNRLDHVNVRTDIEHARTAHTGNRPEGFEIYRVQNPTTLVEYIDNWQIDRGYGPDLYTFNQKAVKNRAAGGLKMTGN